MLPWIPAVIKVSRQYLWSQSRQSLWKWMALELPTGDLAMLSPWRCHHCVCLQLADILLLNQKTNRNPLWLAVAKGQCQKQQIFEMKSKPPFSFSHTHTNTCPLSFKLFLPPSDFVSLWVFLSISLPLSHLLYPPPSLVSYWSHSVRVLLAWRALSWANHDTK